MHQVELQCFEVIGERGTRRVSWQIEHGGQWTPVTDLGDVLAGDDQRPPGTVWRRTYVVALAEGTRLMRVESGPASDVRRDPMDYLMSSPRSARRVSRTYFSVGERGKLVRRAR
jgi:hypothetical protein